MCSPDEMELVLLIISNILARHIPLPSTFKPQDYFPEFHCVVFAIKH